MNFTSATILGTGFTHSDYTKFDAKRGDPAYPMSRSSLCLFAECPAKWIAGFSVKGSDEMLWGSLVDCLLLTPKDFNNRFVVQPATYPGAKGEEKPWSNNATYCREWNAAQEGKTVIKASTLEAVDKAVFGLNADPEIQRILGSADCQVALMAGYCDDDTGLEIPIRGLVDIAPRCGPSLIDLKTLQSANPRDWRRHVAAYHYHVQAALYLDLWNAATGEDRTDFRFILQESTEPFLIGKRFLSQEFIEIGRAKYQADLRLYCQCLQSKCWPNYESLDQSAMCIAGWQITEPEAWMITQGVI